MAGAGFKDFAVGEVLTASDVDTYLMQQAVMRFADSSARAAALGTAVLAEGMTTYLDDTNALEFYDGSGWQRAVAPYGATSPVDGQILTYETSTSTWNPTDQIAGIGTNVAQTLLTTATSFSVSARSFYTTDFGLSVTITPTSSSSKILVVGVLVGNRSVNVNLVAFRFTRNGSAVGVGTSTGSRPALTSETFGGSETVHAASASAMLLDSPATTSAVTYAIQPYNNGGGTRTYYINRTIDDTNNGTNGRYVSSITAIEVAT